MAVSVKHAFVSAIPDSGDTTIVQPSNWNDEHTVVGLGTAAEADTGDFATAAQGAKADSAVQPAAIADMLETSDIGVSVQAWHTNLDDWSNVNPVGYYTASQINAGFQSLEVRPPFTKEGVHLKALTEDDGLHHTLYAAAVMLPSGEMIMFNRTSDTAHHVQDVNAKIYKRVSNDKGTTWTDPVEIYAGDGSTFDPRGIIATVMDAGRIGLIISRRIVAGDYISPVFLYSDDDGDTWTDVVLTDCPKFAGAATAIYPYPASVGGHDTQGFIAYNANEYTALNEIVYLKTEDNGATWQTGTAMAHETDVYLSSLAVVRLGTSDRWIALVRDADTTDAAANGKNALCYKSTDMLTWTGPFDTGQLLNNNPHNALYYEGQIYWLGCNRVYMARPIEQNGITFPDGFVHQWQDAETVWTSNGTDWPDWSDLVSPGKLEGHPYFFQDSEGQNYALFGFNFEVLPDDKFSSSIGMMSQAQIGMDYSSILMKYPPGDPVDPIIEGVWTPVLTFATPGDLSVSYNSQLGSYQRQGKRVDAQFTIITASFTHSTASGEIRIDGLPFTFNVNGTRARGILDYQGITAGAGYTQVMLAPATFGTAFFRVRIGGPGVSRIVASTANIPTGGSIILVGNMTYFTDD